MPGSLAIVTQDEEEALYIVTILKGQFEPGYVEGKHFTPGISNSFFEEFSKSCRERCVLLNSCDNLLAFHLVRV